MTIKIKTIISYLLLTILCALLYLPGITKLPMIDRDSSHFAQATKQMLQTRDYWQVNFAAHPGERADCQSASALLENQRAKGAPSKATIPTRYGVNSSGKRSVR
jgi:hypothetical protein